VLLVAILSVLGAIAPDGGAPHGTLLAAAVQGGGARGLRKSQVDPQVVLNAQFSATSATLLAKSGALRPALVLWPEDVVSLVGTLANSPTEAQLSALAQRLHTTLVVGVTETVSTTAFRNEVVAFAPSGLLVSSYEKVHRVPFGEYVPDRGFFSHLANLSAVPLDAIPGEGDGVLDTPSGKLGTMISYEVFFADRGRIPTLHGAELLLVPTNTSSYATSQVPTQEIAASRLQAIAEGRDLLQSAPTGFSAVIDNRGRVTARTALGTRQVLLEHLSLRTGTTIYAADGNTPVLVLATLSVLGGWIADLVDRRRTAVRVVAVSPAGTEIPPLFEALQS
jgi:apolipoprotein N-acyltransferase